MTAVVIACVLMIPVAVLVGLLSAVNRLQERRAERVSRQIALTDAIHGELGPVVAPVVRRGRRGWIGVLPVPAGQPEIGFMVEIARAELGPGAEIVLIMQEPVPARPCRTPAPAAVAA